MDATISKNSILANFDCYSHYKLMQCSKFLPVPNEIKQTFRAIASFVRFETLCTITSAKKFINKRNQLVANSSVKPILARQFKRHLDVLENIGVISRSERFRDNGSRTTNTISINPESIDNLIEKHQSNNADILRAKAAAAKVVEANKLRVKKAVEDRGQDLVERSKPLKSPKPEISTKRERSIITEDPWLSLNENLVKQKFTSGRQLLDAVLDVYFRSDNVVDSVNEMWELRAGCNGWLDTSLTETNGVLYSNRTKKTVLYFMRRSFYHRQFLLYAYRQLISYPESREKYDAQSLLLKEINDTTRSPEIIGFKGLPNS